MTYSWIVSPQSARPSSMFKILKRKGREFRNIGNNWIPNFKSSLASKQFHFSFIYLRYGQPLNWLNTGAPNRKFEKDLKTTTKIGRLLRKSYLFLTPSKIDGRVPSQQGAPKTCNLTYWEVS